MKTSHDFLTEARSRVHETPLKQCDAAIPRADPLIDVREPDELHAGHLADQNSGFWENPGRVTSTGDQSLAESIQQFESTRSQELSSSVPAFTNTSPGNSSTNVSIWLPQSGQKPRFTCEPSDPRLL